MMLINVLVSTTTLVGGRKTGDVSDMYPTYITPAGYAFTIWSVIYILLAGFVIYQFSRSNESRDSIQSIGTWFIVSCLLNIAWLLLWQYLYIEISVIAMVLLLLSLMVLYVRTRRISYPTIGEFWFVKLPFSLYLGWICVATILNVSIALTKNEWGAFEISDVTWSVIMLCVGSVLAILVSFPYRDSAFPLVFVWAYIAIAMEHREVDKVFLAACILAAILFLYAIWLFFIRNRDRD
ncbi:tryptophan-rich sensory protein [Paenibacillus sp. IHBB 10380]|uniref:tryptophan-rich sensory protein n=1 Tax=Paenibacillus sp. IHBB 10380 TaxID=1566358 RepID=UPI0005CFEE41|nr:tryptophan-rich sensory protein [Paenibacillus sp. IHBB 10380]